MQLSPLLNVGLIAIFVSCAGGNKPGKVGLQSGGKVFNAVVASGDNQTQSAGSLLPERFQVRVTLGAEPFAGAKIFWKATNGKLDIDTSTTGLDGVSIGPKMTLPAKLGLSKITAKIVPEVGKELELVFRATAILGSAKKLVFTKQPKDAMQLTKFGNDIEVSVVDAAGNLVSTANDVVTLVVGTNPRNGHLLGPATVSAQAGKALFSGMSIDAVGEGYTLQANAPNRSSAISSAFNILDAGWTIAPCSDRATSGTVGTTVRLKACLRNNAKLALDNIVVGWEQTSIGGKLNATTSLTNSQGAAEILYTLSRTAGSNAVDANLTIGTKPLTAKFQLVGAPGVSKKLVFGRQPTGSNEYRVLGTSPMIKVLDPDGNLAASFNGDIQLDLEDNPTSGRLLGTKTMVARDGIAEFSDLSVDKASEGYTLIATAEGLAPVISQPFTVSSGLLQIVAHPQYKRDAKVETILTSPFTAIVVDQSNNPVPDVVVNWASNNVGASVASSKQSITDAEGKAVSPDVTMGILPEKHSFLASIASHDLLSPAEFIVQGYSELVFNPCPANINTGSVQFKLRVQPAPEANTKVKLWATRQGQETIVLGPLTQTVTGGFVTFSGNFSVADNYTVFASILRADASDPQVSGAGCLVIVR